MKLKNILAVFTSLMTNIIWKNIVRFSCWFCVLFTLQSCANMQSKGTENATASSSEDSVKDKNSINGTWNLVSSKMEKDGKVTDTFGASAKGMLVLQSNGRFMLSIIKSDIPKFASNNRSSGTNDENKAVVSGSMAMFGSFTFDKGTNKLTMKIDTATFPNWNGAEQVRDVATLTGTDMAYTNSQGSGGGKTTVSWKRIE